MAFPMSISVNNTNGAPVTINDVERFCRHLQGYHLTGTSIHTESGHAFRVDDAFRAAVQDQVEGENLFS